MTFLIYSISAFLILIIVYNVVKKKALLPQPDSEKEKKILHQHVLFYQRLNNEEKINFEKRISTFLQKIRITGVETKVEDIDKIFVAAAAIIPVFAFDNWEYNNINEVLLYPNSFNENYDIKGNGRSVLGMVGNGTMQNVMILSQQELRNGFLNVHTKSNTGIHEFVHLIDKDDGETDGCPQSLLHYKYTLPWLKHIHKEIQLIHAGHSDINPYGATNESEFLAVAAEYFFEQPQLLQRKHPELYALLNQIFMPINENNKENSNGITNK